MCVCVCVCVCFLGRLLLEWAGIVVSSYKCRVMLGRVGSGSSFLGRWVLLLLYLSGCRGNVTDQPIYVVTYLAHQKQEADESNEGFTYPAKYLESDSYMI
ncbi:hypothetical protein F4778DRAFT_744996 [Xylariomycetidae sp. FL2044]|nr:hypothetical protein F4778DRAFT_744996 [Xylariomycetidae sp. FL2044]